MLESCSLGTRDTKVLIGKTEGRAAGEGKGALEGVGMRRTQAQDTFVPQAVLLTGRGAAQVSGEGSNRRACFTLEMGYFHKIKQLLWSHLQD